MMRTLLLATVMCLAQSACVPAKLQRPEDLAGSWRVEALHEAGTRRAPAREILVAIERTERSGEFRVKVDDINGRERWIEVDGRHVARARSDRLVADTLLACRRIELATGQVDLDDWERCRHVERDDDLVVRIFTEPLGWTPDQDGLVINSLAADASIELRPSIKTSHSP